MSETLPPLTAEPSPGPDGGGEEITGGFGLPVAMALIVGSIVYRRQKSRMAEPEPVPDYR